MKTINFILYQGTDQYLLRAKLYLIQCQILICTEEEKYIPPFTDKTIEN